VADRRDEVADHRDRLADAREQAADAREVEFDVWERQLDARAGELGTSVDDAHSAAERAAARARRLDARRDRDAVRAERATATADRKKAVARPQADNAPTLLAMTFAGIAERLFDADYLDDVLRRIAESAVSTVDGCRMASVTLKEPNGCRTGAFTDQVATAVDELQFRAHQGPCLDALDTPIVYAASFPDERWPALASDPAGLGVQSAISYRLDLESSESATFGRGSLNLYGSTPDAFDRTAREIGLILAVHASVAIRVAHEHGVIEGMNQGLHQALLSRDVIGQAKGILMERLKITPEDAFDFLSRASQHLNLKLREVARRLAETGEIP
jgi:hypothetical protein